MTDKRIEDYALIGDGETAALIHRSGTIEWLCLPHFDSPACFAALLGTEENGCWALAPDDAPTACRRSYRGDTLVLETEFDTPGGKVAVIDFMPTLRGEAPDVVRIVEGRAGKVAMTGKLALFGFKISTATFDVAREDGIIEMRIQASDDETLDFGFETMSIHGEARSNGTFSFSGSAHVSVGVTGFSISGLIYTATITIEGPGAVPADLGNTLKGVRAGAAAELTWLDVGGADGYRVYSGTAKAEPLTTVLEGGAASGALGVQLLAPPAPLAFYRTAAFACGVEGPR